jgi:hypothetical protein
VWANHNRYCGIAALCIMLTLRISASRRAPLLIIRVLQTEAGHGVLFRQPYLGYTGATLFLPRAVAESGARPHTVTTGAEPKKTSSAPRECPTHLSQMGHDPAPFTA